MKRNLMAALEAQSNTEETTEVQLFDENDVDYLNHLVVKYDENELDVAVEGYARAFGHDTVSIYTDAYRHTKGIFIGIESKRRYIEEICDDLIEWCNDKKHEHRNLHLVMGAFDTWLKTSETYWWRYFFLLNNNTWNHMLKNLKEDKTSKLESANNSMVVRAATSVLPYANLFWFVGDLFNESEAKKEAAQLIDNARTIDDLVKLVELYKKRSNEFFKTVIQHRSQINGTPFQVILIGATDLRRSVKKTINLAI